MAKKPTKYTVTDGKMVLVMEVAEEGGFTVTSPFIQGLVTEAETLEEAFEMARDVIALFKKVRAADRVAERRLRRSVRKRQPAFVAG